LDRNEIFFVVLEKRRSLVESADDPGARYFLQRFLEGGFDEAGNFLRNFLPVIAVDLAKRLVGDDFRAKQASKRNRAPGFRDDLELRVRNVAIGLRLLKILADGLDFRIREGE